MEGDAKEGEVETALVPPPFEAGIETGDEKKVRVQH